MKTVDVSASNDVQTYIHTNTIYRDGSGKTVNIQLHADMYQGDNEETI